MATHKTRPEWRLRDDYELGELDEVLRNLRLAVENARDVCASVQKNRDDWLAGKERAWRMRQPE